MRKMRTAVAFTTLATIACVLVAIGASSATAPPAAAAPALAPKVITGPATSNGSTSETLSGTVNPHGQVTTYFFNYGTTTAYGTDTTHTTVGNGSTGVPVTAAVTGLTPGTVYHYRLVAVNATGTTPGADATFTAAAPTTSQVRVMGREGFVSPGKVIGVELGCFAGQTTCTGHIAMTNGTTVVGQRDYSIPPESGGFHNLKLTPQGAQLLTRNHRYHLVGVKVTVTDSTGQTLDYVIHLANWIWH